MREDALALYGFLRPEEKQLFEKLITVSGIGPKLAITILSGMATADMVGAIRGNDFARLTKIPGIGRKTAERMCVELRDKLEGFGAPQAVVSHSAVEEDVISALTNLGYQRALAEKAVERAVQSAGRENFDAIFRPRWDAVEVAALLFPPGTIHTPNKDGEGWTVPNLRFIVLFCRRVALRDCRFRVFKHCFAEGRPHAGCDCRFGPRTCRRLPASEPASPRHRAGGHRRA